MMSRPGDVVAAHGAVVGALGLGVSTLGEAERTVVGGHQDILLFESEPELLGVVVEQGPGVGRVDGLVGVEHLAQHNVAAFAKRVVVHAHGLEHTVGVVALGLPRGTAVEPPHRTTVEFSRERVGVDCLSLGPDVDRRFITVQPYVVQPYYSHAMLLGPLDVGKRVAA
jgi:hypothetical protein